MGKKSRSKPGPVSQQVEYAHNLVGFLARYFPSFMCSIFMCIFSIATATAVITKTYFRDDLDNGSYSALFIMAASVILTVGGFLLSRGRLWAMWILVAILVASLLAVVIALPAQNRLADFIISMLGMLFPSLGLLSLNSKRSRELREQLVFNRAVVERRREENRRYDELERNRERLRKNKIQRNKYREK
ncbi:hypothetical protein [Pseudomonas syringae]|uniref:hypothetical protein n=1 Tax=Pseudomonas syringae TaxID=317 RepID=UPI0004178BBB|nr:hypothetical protein [Pseudomonas syringae]